MTIDITATESNLDASKSIGPYQDSGHFTNFGSTSIEKFKVRVLIDALPEGKCLTVKVFVNIY